MTGADVVTGSDIVGALLLRSAQMVALVSPGNMKAGRLPPNVTLPALLVRVISTVERQPLKQGAWVRQVDRVSVTVRARSHRERKLAVFLMRAACAGFVGAIAGAERVSVRTAGAGPEVDGPGDTYERAQDFRVSFETPVSRGE